MAKINVLFKVSILFQKAKQPFQTSIRSLPILNEKSVRLCGLPERTFNLKMLLYLTITAFLKDHQTHSNFLQQVINLHFCSLSYALTASRNTKGMLPSLPSNCQFYKDTLQQIYTLNFILPTTDIFKQVKHFL